MLFFYLGLNLFAKSKSIIKESISTKELKIKDILYPNLISLRVSLLHTVDHQMQTCTAHPASCFISFLI